MTAPKLKICKVNCYAQFANAKKRVNKKKKKYMDKSQPKYIQFIYSEDLWTYCMYMLKYTLLKG